MAENKDNQLGIESIGYAIKEELSQETENILEKLNNKEKLINYKKSYFKGENNTDYDFSEYTSLKELFKAIFYRRILIPSAEREKNNFDDMLDTLKAYKPRNKIF